MPEITFTITQNRFDKIQNAMTSYAEYNPLDPAVDENDFAKKAFLAMLQVYLNRHRQTRIETVKTQLSECSDATWTQITGILG